MNVVFAPDWRLGNPYQHLLSAELARHGTNVTFLDGYKRVMPLTRGIRGGNVEILHLHWPEAYFPDKGLRLVDLLREWRYTADLYLATRHAKLVATAHNLFPHWGRGRASYWWNMRYTYRSAKRVVAHSKAAASELVSRFGVRLDRIAIIPHGDLSISESRLPDRPSARTALGLPKSESLAIMFGAVSPYKGIEQVIDFWNSQRPRMKLAVVGKAASAEYSQALKVRAKGSDVVVLEIDQFVPDVRLALWLAAADVCIFNYRDILTSGSAIHARTLGIPLLFPSRLRFTELGEPDPRVMRFDALNDNFVRMLSRSESLGRDYEAAAWYREAISWERIAEDHRAVYGSVTRKETTPCAE
jgi:beta-1,4-mannosyltransferase